MWWYDFWPMPWMLFGPLFMIALIVGCAVMMVFMMRHRGHGGFAAQILKERFARGEIDKAEYEERRRVLGA